MGDAPFASSKRQSVSHADHDDLTQQSSDGLQSQGKAFEAPGEQSRGPQGPFYSQIETIPHGVHGGPLVNPYAQYSLPQPMQQYDMSLLAQSLPDGSSSPSAHTMSQHPSFARGVPAQSPITMGFPPQQMPSYRPQPSFHGNFPVHQPRMQQHPHAIPSHYYGPYPSAPSPMTMRHPGQSNAGFDAAFAGMYGRPEMVAQHVLSQTYPGLNGRELAPQPTPSYPRGPPRKPKQSGHALWVGNLPPGANITALKDHFSREATKDIESLFLISKSNCAFVNYRTEGACAAAMNRFLDSRFQGLRLVCRLRRGNSSTTAPTTQPEQIKDGPEKVKESEIEAPDKEEKESTEVVIVASSSDQPPKQREPIEKSVASSATSTPVRVPERYFVVKSLTLQDLEASVRNGVWATQVHNEIALKKAYESADNVYLIFSANKSGEYFGYARMTSNIAIDPVTTNPKSEAEKREGENGPKSIPTPATQWAPKGRIVDDSARGTIFWEADSSELDTNEGTTSPRPLPQEEPTGPKQGQDWGKPFAVEWHSTNRLPFYRTRGLRNPWNENREVKIARDGTEIEPGIGQRLVQMFHRPPPTPQTQMSPATPNYSN